MKEGEGQDRVNVWQFCSWARSWGVLLLSAVCYSTLQLYKVHLPRSPLISDEKRLWMFHHGWAAEAGKGSRSPFKGRVMQVLWKAARVELSSKRSDRHTHALITLAQLGGHLLSLQQHFPSLFPFQWTAAPPPTLKGLLPSLEWQETTTPDRRQKLCLGQRSERSRWTMCFQLTCPILFTFLHLKSRPNVYLLSEARFQAIHGPEFGNRCAGAVGVKINRVLALGLDEQDFFFFSV